MQKKQYLDRAPARGRRAKCCSSAPLGRGLWSGLGFGAPYFFLLLLAAAIERPEYRGMSFGVISLLGDDQAYEIEQLLLRHLSPEEYQRRRIVCGNSAQFQGDERDV